MVIIGVTGKKHSGKDTVANVLERDFGFVRYPFAFPIKRALQVIFDWDERHTDGDLKEVVDPRWGVTPRQAMQHMGTEWGQFDLARAFPLFKETVGRKLWALRFKYWYAKLNPGDSNEIVPVVISDMRFPHEAEVIKSMGGYIIRVLRDTGDAPDTHASEVELERIVPDYTLKNDGTIADLENRVHILMRGE